MRSRAKWYWVIGIMLVLIPAASILAGVIDPF